MVIRTSAGPAGVPVRYKAQRPPLRRMLLSDGKTAAWACPADKIGGLGHGGERLQRPAGAGGLLRVWGELPPSFSPQTVLPTAAAAARNELSSTLCSVFIVFSLLP